MRTNRPIPSSGKKKAHKHKSFWPVTPLVTGGSPDREASESKFYVLSSEPKEHKSFCPGTRPGGPVTGATGNNLMCKSFMCLAAPYICTRKITGRKYCFLNTYHVMRYMTGKRNPRFLIVHVIYFQDGTQEVIL